MRNPCKECIYHISENNTCNSKKCATGDGRITFWDRLFCKPNTGENKKVRLIDAEDAVRLFEQSYPNDGQMSCHDAIALLATLPTMRPWRIPKDVQYEIGYQHGKKDALDEVIRLMKANGWKVEDAGL